MRDALEWAHDVSGSNCAEMESANRYGHDADCNTLMDIIIAARREAFEAGYRAALNGTDVDLSRWPMSVAWNCALERAGLKP